MASKSNTTEVIIDGKVYMLSGYEEEEYLQRVASYINHKINKCQEEMKDMQRLPLDMKAALIHLNIADDYFKARDRIEELEQDLEIKEKAIFDLKQDLISEQIKAETSEKTIKDLEAQNKELSIQNVKLESDLEDMLMDVVSREDTKAEKQ